MKKVCDGFEFDFTDAINVIIFDEKDKNNPNFHGLSHAMKAVDLIVELSDCYLFIEVKDFHQPDDYKVKDAFSHLRESLKYKFRDTWLYRWCEDKLDKPIKYLCLLELDSALLIQMTKELKKQLPMGATGPRWNQQLAMSCVVLNSKIWNQKYPEWPIKRS